MSAPPASTVRQQRTGLCIDVACCHAHLQLVCYRNPAFLQASSFTHFGSTTIILVNFVRYTCGGCCFGSCALPKLHRKLLASMASVNSASPVTNGLPDEVITCLQNARFLHLSTCANNVPHIALMNYTYLPSSPYSSHPTIIMTTPPSSRKTHNLESNPLVSVLVHDWVSHRPPTLNQPGRSPSPSRPNPRFGPLAELLLGINSASLSDKSTQINGIAQIVPSGSEEEAWYRAQHLANNTFESTDAMNANSPLEGGLWGGGGAASHGHDETAEGDGGTKCYVEGEEVRVVVVKIRDGRTTDWKGQVRDWVVGQDAPASLTNGI
ncbi:unnamed protein product [Periconia digitata]|uniref:Pyridoxamine 5'-phosphate oxidase N-terminal domain-containing protein n=1 Tax=Periconia digitata TaxID=1303443 RepID=A0A9W4UH28_9PLEO|nr:unnamed protein product [Periconia digitata]